MNKQERAEKAKELLQDYQQHPNKKFTSAELSLISDYLLREQADAVDPETGKKRGLKGEAPILFQSQIDDAHRREIYNKNGSPDPSIQAGIYWRQHPKGRRVSSEESRRVHGSGYYR